MMFTEDKKTVCKVARCVYIFWNRFSLRLRRFAVSPVFSAFVLSEANRLLAVALGYI